MTERKETHKACEPSSSPPKVETLTIRKPTKLVLNNFDDVDGNMALSLICSKKTSIPVGITKPLEIKYSIVTLNTANAHKQGVEFDADKKIMRVFPLEIKP